MNLYKIIFSHTAPKDTERGIKTYLLAKNDEEVYNYVDKVFNCGCWKDNEKDGEIFKIYNKDYKIIGTETFHEKIIRLKGEINDEDYDFSDAYYGISLYGWELIKENIKDDLSIPIELKIILYANT